MSETIIHTILWRRLDTPGHDACCLCRQAGGWRLTGAAVFVHEAQPCHLAYDVACDSAWRTQAAGVTGWIGRQPLSIEIEAQPDGDWFLNGQPQEAARGGLDPDLAFTPATNLLPLRRLALSVGDAADAPAAWLRFPELDLVRLDQHYRRIDDTSYVYAAPDTGYSGTLEVDPAGFVISYPGLWERQAIL